MSPLRTAAGLVVALLISSGGPALAETSCDGGCAWVHRDSTSRLKRPGFSLSVALRVFSFTRASKTVLPETASVEAELRDLERVEAELAFQASQLGLEPPRRGLPQMFSWLRGWRLEKDRGLFRPIRSRSRFAFAYSDVFETGGDPDKGGHGLGLLFRRDLN